MILSKAYTPIAACSVLRVGCILALLTSKPGSEHSKEVAGVLNINNIDVCAGQES